MNDSHIVDAYLRRDEAALRMTADAYGPRLRALAFGITEDSQIAEECENDTYFEAWQSIPPHEPRGYLYAFLARITRHLALNRCRDRQRQKRSALLCELCAEMEQCLPAEDPIAERIDDLAFGEILNRFLESLSSEKRWIFLRRYWTCDSAADIAGQLGISESKVKSILFRIRNQLRKHLEKEGYSL